MKQKITFDPLKVGLEKKIDILTLDFKNPKKDE